MEPIFENISANIGSSFYYHLLEGGCNTALWHIHPEYELVYIHSGSAERHIGSNVSRYSNGDLILIGSNIPHSNLGNVDFKDNYEIVVQMPIDLIENRFSNLVEFRSIKKLFDRSKHGISFGQAVKDKAGRLLTKMNQLDPFERFISLIEVLMFLANSRDYELLNAHSVTVELQSNDYARIQKINEFVSKNYSRTIKLNEMAGLTGLTESSFSRFFRKVTGKTFSTFLNEYRVQKAGAILLECNNSITDVMLDSGFTEPAYFSRTFKKLTGQTPSEYRKARRNW